MGDQSHREEMSAAIRAQRERHAVPRSIAPEAPPPPPAAKPVPEPEPPPVTRKGLLWRFRNK
jgi:hypothetical protein